MGGMAIREMEPGRPEGGRSLRQACALQARRLRLRPGGAAREYFGLFRLQGSINGSHQAGAAVLDSEAQLSHVGART